MNFIFFIILFISGIITGSIVNTQFWIPLLYSLPKTIYLFSKGKVRFKAIPSLFVTPIVWYFICVAVFVLTNSFIPFIHDQILFSPAFITGWLFSLIGMISNFFTVKGRKDMASDYELTTLKKFGKESKFKEWSKKVTQNALGNLNESAKPEE